MGLLTSYIIVYMMEKLYLNSSQLKDDNAADFRQVAVCLRALVCVQMNECFELFDL